MIISAPILLLLLIFSPYVLAVKTKQNCNTFLTNQLVSVESVYFPGHLLAPVTLDIFTGKVYMRLGYTVISVSREEYASWDHIPWGGDQLIFSRDDTWRLEKCGSSLCIASLKKQYWGTYLMINTELTPDQIAVPMLKYVEDFNEPAQDWTVKFDIECEECQGNKTQNCHFLQRNGLDQKKDVRRMFVADASDSQLVSHRSYFAAEYDETKDDLFNWNVHIHVHLPPDISGGDHLVIFHSIIIYLGILSIYCM